MQTYLVGGAVRDELLGLPVSENDWVVVGASPQDMLDLGYQQVGSHFPVFLNPETKEEYALARTEKKTGAGYGGFSVDFSPDISLEEDLLRRDLTINAIARSNTGQLIDHYGGLQDLKNRTLRHVSEAFVEDPLRVLRVARFRASLDSLGFTIHPKTFALMKTICEGDELLALSSERIWIELQKGLSTSAPDRFIETLYQCGALKKIMPELDKRFLHSDNLRDTAERVGQRILQALAYLARLDPNRLMQSQLKQSRLKQSRLKQGRLEPGTREGERETKDSGEAPTSHKLLTAWVICCHALEDSTSPKNLVPKTVGKIDSANSNARKLSESLTAPNEFKRLATLGSFYLHIIIQARHCNPQTIVDLLDACDAWRKPEGLAVLLLAAECLTSTNAASPQHNLGSIALLRQAHKNCRGVDAEAFVARGLSGEAVGEAIRAARKVAVAELKKQFA